MNLIGTRNAPGFVAEAGLSDAKLKFRGDVQGLRAIAVLAVIIFHAQRSWLPAGFIGVDIFFVISGFLISSIIIEREKAFSWSGFYWQRVKRIVPVYIAMLVVVTCISSILFIHSDFSYFKKSVVSAFFSEVTNIFPFSAAISLRGRMSSPYCIHGRWLLKCSSMFSCRP